MRLLPAIVVLLAGCMPALDRPGFCVDGGQDSADMFHVPDFVGPGWEGGSGQCTEPCALGCNKALSRCYRLKPSNFGVDKLHDQATATLTLSAADLTIDTDTGEIKDGTSVIRAAGGQGTAVSGVFWDVVSQGAGAPEIAVFGVASLELQTGATATVVGARALAIYAGKSATIAGTLIAPAIKQSGGPGGFAGGLNDTLPGAACGGGEGQGGQQGPAGSDGDGGGGGGGLGGAGGNGADSDYPTPSPASKGGTGGSASGAATLVPLRGGCGAGAGGGPENGPGGYGGGGGGAVQLAVNGTLDVSGVITTPGAGGDGGHDGAAGGGGGSGGAILLEAVDLKLTGTLAANGGGGGSGSGGPGDDDVPDGEDGKPNDQPAQGGAEDSAYGGPGGAGGAGTTADGSPPAKLDANGGGGGGGVGRIRLNATTSDPTQATVVSPGATTSDTVGTW